MKKTLICLIFVLASLAVAGQKISNVDLALIEKAISDTASEFYYPDLMERFYANDTSLSLEDYHHIYYGWSFSDKYTPYRMSPYEDKMTGKMREGKYKAAISQGEKELEENPVNIKVLFYMLYIYDKMDDAINAKKYARHYFGLLDVIYASGDGKSVETAYVVITVTDEYSILRDLGLESKGQALLGEGPTDRLDIDTKNQEKKKGEKKIKEMYFNVSILFGHASKMFKDEKDE